MTREVEAQQWSAERECDRVSGVRVLRAAVEENGLRLVGTPTQRAQVGAGAGGCLDSFDGRATAPRDGVVSGAVAEQSELFVSGHR